MLKSDWKLIKNQKNELKSKGLIIEGHFEKITSIVITSDKKYIISSSYDGTIRIWNYQNISQEFILEGHKDSVNSLALSVDDKFLASCSDDKTVRLWDVNGRRLINVLNGHSAYVNSVFISYNSKFIASGSGFIHNYTDISIRIWDLHNQKELQVIKGHKLKINCVSMTHDSNYLISGSDDCQVRVWYVNKPRLRCKFKGHRSYITCVTVTKKSKYVISGSIDYTIRLWSIKKYCQVHCFYNPAGRQIYSISLTPNSRYLLSGSSKVSTYYGESFGVSENISNSSDSSNNIKTIKDYFYKPSCVLVWDIKKKKLVDGFYGLCMGVTSISITSDGKEVVLCLLDRSICVYSLKDKVKGCDMKCHRRVVKFICNVSDLHLVTACKDKSIRLWNLKTNTQESVFYDHAHKIKRVFCAFDDRHAFSYDVGGRMIVWDVHQRGKVGEICLENSDKTFGVTKDSKYIIAASALGWFKVYCINKLIKPKKK